MRRALMIIVFASGAVFSAPGMCVAAGDSVALAQALSHVENNVIHGAQTHQSPAQSLRDEAIGRAAVVYGAQSGRYYRWKQLQSLLMARAHLLSRVFNFGALYVDHGLVQPPVLDMSSQVTHLSNSGQMRELINNVYRVLIPATFQSRPITWQSFLLPDSLSVPASPRAALLPRNTHEKSLWMQRIRTGWGQGIVEANSEFDTRLDSINNAYQGMVLYTMLAMRGMVAPPQLIITTKTVERAADGQQMAVGVHEQVISKKSYFVAAPNRWKPVYYQHDFSSPEVDQ